MAATDLKTNIIDLPLFDLQYNKNIKKIRHYIELKGAYMIFVIECYMDIYPKPDDDIGIIKYEDYCNQVDRIRKSDIYWIKSRFEDTVGCWSVSWYYGSEDTYCNFETEHEAGVFEKQLMDWLGW